MKFAYNYYLVRIKFNSTNLIYDLPLYDKRGFVRHITKWHSISSGSTNLLQTGHLIPVNIGQKRERKRGVWALT